MSFATRQRKDADAFQQRKLIFLQDEFRNVKHSSFDVMLPLQRKTLSCVTFLENVKSVPRNVDDVFDFAGGYPTKRSCSRLNQNKTVYPSMSRLVNVFGVKFWHRTNIKHTSTHTFLAQRKQIG